VRSRDALFVTHDFGARIRATHEAMLMEVASINGDELLNTSPSALAEYLADRHRIDVPVLNESGITVDQREAPVAVNTFIYQVPEGPGTWFDYYVPFEREAVAFECRASRFSTSAPRGQITGNELRLSYGVPHDKRVDVGPQFANDLARDKQHLNWLHEDAVPHNTGASRCRPASNRTSAREALG